MPNPFFKFKHFTVYHDKCAMKVGTDGVLLGAWANTDNANSALDIGAGSGLISLMLAQRNKNLSIDAIDIDKQAIEQAQENIINSPFKERINCIHQSLQDFTIESDNKYDLIVSNPPFFLHSLKSPDSKRTLARHTNSLYIDELISIAANHLNKNGHLAIVYPYDKKESLARAGIKNNLYVSAITNVFPTPTSLAKRVLIEFSFLPQETLKENNLIIERERHVYTPEFTELTRNFYLDL